MLWWLPAYVHLWVQNIAIKASTVNSRVAVVAKEYIVLLKYFRIYPLYNSIPAIAAVINPTSNPPIIERTPIRAKSGRRCGAIPASPPIVIPIAPIFAKLHSAYVAITTARFEMVGSAPADPLVIFPFSISVFKSK